MTAAALLFAVLQLQPALDRASARDVADAIHDAGLRHDLDHALLLALAFNESGLDVRKVNPRTRCAGLMQIAPVHHAGLPRSTILSARWSALEGARILRAAIDRCGDTERALSAYNGRGCRRSSWARQVLADAARVRLLARGPTT